MPCLTFVPPDVDTPRVIEAALGEAFLDIVRRAQLPLYWRCGRGTCAACAVRVIHAAQPSTMLLSSKERNVLVRHGFLPKSALSSLEFPDTPQAWRLACYLSVTGDCEVHW